MIYSIIMGALAGWLASIFMKKNAEMGWLKKYPCRYFWRRHRKMGSRRNYFKV